jgi:hypothetical protein
VATGGGPDIQLHAVVDARSVKIEKQGQASLRVWAEPDAGSIVNFEAPKANGAKTLRNVRVTLDAEARIGANGSAGAQSATPGQQETDTAQPR